MTDLLSTVLELHVLLSALNTTQMLLVDFQAAQIHVGFNVSHKLSAPAHINWLGSGSATTPSENVLNLKTL